MSTVPGAVGIGPAINAAQKATSSFNPLGLIAGFAGGLLNSAGDYYSNQKLMQQQNEFNRQQIAEQNSYNSPTAIKNRLIAAGVPEKAALMAIAGNPSLGQQSSVATAAQPVGNLPGTNFMQGLSSGISNSLVDAQAINQRINNADQRTINKLQIKELNEQIFGLGLSNKGKQKDLYYQPFIRNLEVANLDLHHLIGLYELCQYQLALNENPYVDFINYDLFSESGPDSTDSTHMPRALVPEYTEEGLKKFIKERGEYLQKNRASTLREYSNAIRIQLKAQGIDEGRLDYLASGIKKEGENHLKSLDVESLRLIAQGKIEELKEHLANTSLSKKEWLFKLTDLLSTIGPLMSTLMQGTQAIDNVSSSISRQRMSSHVGNWQPSPGSTSFSW